ncbi:SLC13 family permease, partial [Actinophytocola sp.]|uniref:SLC13 family permease n=1 Tax=Actinophytocola sp. TaxID=1872138 RepID=UPI002ED9B2E1
MTATERDPGHRAQRTDVDAAFRGSATYRSLGEQQLSPAEERFEKGRRTVGLFLAPLVTIVFALLPIDLPRDQHLLAAILLGVIVLWITEPVPIPVGGLIGIGAIVVLGVVPADDALAPFGSTTVFTFIGAFILAMAMLKHGLARRFAMFVLSLTWVGTSTYRVVIAFGAITCLLSAFVSNTATVAMLLPTALGIISVIAKLLQEKELVQPDFDPLRLRVGVAVMLMLAYGASVGGLLTPVGTPPNLIGRGLIEEATGERIGFLDWMLMALPICALMFVALAAVLLLLNKPEIRRIE